MESPHDNTEEMDMGRLGCRRRQVEDIHRPLNNGDAVEEITIPTARPQIDVDDIKGKAIYTDKDVGDSGVQRIQNETLESWVIQIKQRFESHQYKIRQPSSDVSIYRVPKTIMDFKPDAYVPLVVCFGPYHHHKKDQQLPAMDDHKLEAVQRTLERFKGMSIHHLIAEVGKLEKKIRNCYEDSAIEYSKEALIWMVTMDACFLLEFFLTLQTELLKEEDHISLVFQYNGRQNILRWEIMRDIVKLENQIPLFILIHVLELGLQNHDKAVTTLGKLLIPLPVFRGFPFSLQLSDNEIRSRLEEHINNGACHLLDLSRKVIKDFLTQSSTNSSTSAITARSSSSRDDVSIPTAEKLHMAGIKFAPSKGNVWFEGRRFRDSKFYLPQFTIDDDTEIILRNLMAFEECQGCRWSPEPTIISTYMNLMDDIIDSSQDVDLLRKQKVIKSLVGSDDEIAAMINDMCKGITSDPCHQYKGVVKEVREHYDSELKLLISQFKQENCSKPWYVVSLVAATLLLGMTAVQTIFTVKQ